MGQPDEEAVDEVQEDFDLVDGSLTATPVSSSAWTLALSGGVLEDEDGEPSDLSLEDDFERCDVSVDISTPD